MPTRTSKHVNTKSCLPFPFWFLSRHDKTQDKTQDKTREAKREKKVLLFHPFVKMKPDLELKLKVDTDELVTTATDDVCS